MEGIIQFYCIYFIAYYFSFTAIKKDTGGGKVSSILNVSGQAGKGNGNNNDMKQKLRPRRSALGDISNKAMAKVASTAMAATNNAIESVKNLVKSNSNNVQILKRARTSTSDDKVTKVSRKSADSSDLMGTNSNEMGKNSSTIDENKRTTSRSSLDNNSAKPSNVTAAPVSKERDDSDQIVVSVAGSALPKTTVAVPSRSGDRFNRSFSNIRKSIDPSTCADLLDEMYAIYYDLEEEYSPAPYMEIQTDINHRMRAILIDWLIEVHHKFKLHTSTLWLCVHIIDRFLQVTNIDRQKLQLVGISSLLISCKFEEIYPPEVRDCVYITDFAYTREEVLSMENEILKKLNYEICVPTGYHFLARFLDCIKASERTRNLAFYYAERNLQEVDILLIKPHVLACTSVYCALLQQSSQYPSIKTSSWPKCLEEESGYEEGDLLEWAKTIIKHVNEEPETASRRKLIAAKKKYSSERYNNISGLPLPFIHS